MHPDRDLASKSARLRLIAAISVTPPAESAVRRGGWPRRRPLAGRCADHGGRPVALAGRIGATRRQASGQYLTGSCRRPLIIKRNEATKAAARAGEEDAPGEARYWIRMLVPACFLARQKTEALIGRQFSAKQFIIPRLAFLARFESHEGLKFLPFLASDGCSRCIAAMCLRLA